MEWSWIEIEVNWMGWDGIRWDGMGWDWIGWDGIGLDGIGKLRTTRAIFSLLYLRSLFLCKVLDIHICNLPS